MTAWAGTDPTWLDVSRETLAKLEAYCDLVQKWNSAINLVAKKQIGELWNRHILDSAQLSTLLDAGPQAWCDLGSGAGFPGIVIAILAEELNPATVVTLVEVDQRKAVFLRQVARELALSAQVEATRAESLEPQLADIVSARALAPLSQLLPLAVRHLKPGGTAVFLKGAAAGVEVAEARKLWAFEITEQQSRTSPDGKILILRDIQHASLV